MSTPVADGFRMPAEWERHTRCWMAWPCRPESFPNGLDTACAAYAEVAQTIAQFEPVAMVCNQADVAEVSLACGAGIEVLPMPISDSWIRDTGPTFVVNNAAAGGGQVAGVDLGVNAWGEKYSDHQVDAHLGRHIPHHPGQPR